MRIISKKLLHIYSLIAFLAITLLAAMLLLARTGWQMSERYVPLAGSAQVVKSETSQFHLWFEEMIGGDKSLNEKEVWAHLDRAERRVDAMMHGGIDGGMVIIPLDDPQLFKKMGRALISIEELRILGKQRLENGIAGAIGSNLEQEFDKAFFGVLEVSDEAEKALQLAIAKEIRNFKFVVYALVVLMVMVSIVMAFLFYKYEQSKIAAAKQIQALAFYDWLTKLPNRGLLHDRLGQAMASSKRTGIYGALIYLDLDKFKQLNDAYGHSVGDQLLVEVAHRIIGCVRQVDTVSRFGGDEFVIVLSELDKGKVKSVSQASIIAEKIRGALAEPYALKIQHDGNIETTIEYSGSSSIGLVLFANYETSIEDVIKSADIAMYKVKNAGHDGFEYHEPTT